MTPMVATVRMRLGGRWLSRGDRFVAEDRDVAGFVQMRWAEVAPEEGSMIKPAPPPPAAASLPESVALVVDAPAAVAHAKPARKRARKRSNTYKRRDMQAEK